MSASEVKKRIIDTYKNKFSHCESRHKEFIRYMPGGCTKSLSYFTPFPLHLKRGEGAFVYTHQEQKLLDVINGYGSLIHGHAHKKIAGAVAASLENGTMYAAPTDEQFEFTKLLCDRISTLERVRLCNSGTEATIFAIRTARAYSKKDKILKVRGGYHGTQVCLSDSADGSTLPGTPKGMTRDVVEVTFNNTDEFEQVFNKHKSELAAVIIEPFLGAGGIIPPQDGYLKKIREITEQNNVLLIFDEVFSFRAHAGGAQEIYGVRPDIIALGKIIGGGFPIGAFGGKREIMDIYCQEATEIPLHHSGSFNGHQTALIAGRIALADYDQQEIDRLNELGKDLKVKLDQAFKELELNIQCTQVSSFLNIHFVAEEVLNSTSVQKSEPELLQLLHLSLLNRGVYATPRGLFILSTPMKPSDINFLAESVIDSLKELKPLIKEKYPHLVY